MNRKCPQRPWRKPNCFLFLRGWNFSRRLCESSPTSSWNESKEWSRSPMMLGVFLSKEPLERSEMWSNSCKSGRKEWIEDCLGLHIRVSFPSFSQRHKPRSQILKQAKACGTDSLLGNSFSVDTLSRVKIVLSKKVMTSVKLLTSMRKHWPGLCFVLPEDSHPALSSGEPYIHAC